MVENLGRELNHVVWKKDRLHLKVVFSNCWLRFYEFVEFVAVKLTDFTQEILVDALVSGAHRFVGLTGHRAHWVCNFTFFSR